MKKFTYLFALLAVVMFTACGSDNDPVNKQSFSITTDSRTIDGNEVAFYQGTANVEVNFTDMVILFTTNYKDANGESHNLTTPEMKLNSASYPLYSFNMAANNGIDKLQGFLDMNTGMMWYSFVIDGSATVVSSTHLLYAYTTTNMTNPENGKHGSNEQSAYLIAPDTRGETCKMQISNLMTNLGGTVDAPIVQYEGLTLVPNESGFKVTADKAESNYKGFYTLTDVDFTLSDQGKIINGSFKCNGLEYTVSGRLFPNTSNF